jgi:hypothetical protein
VIELEDLIPEALEQSRGGCWIPPVFFKDDVADFSVAKTRFAPLQDLELVAFDVELENRQPVHAYQDTVKPLKRYVI